MSRDTAAMQLAKDYNGVSTLRGFADLFMCWGGIVLVLYAVYVTGSIALGVLAVFLIAGFQNALSSLAHETFHYKAFQAKFLNDLVGGFLYSYPLALPYQHYRKRHMEHHRKVGRSDDPDWGNYQGPQFETASSVYKSLFSRLLGAYLFINVFLLATGRNPPVLMKNEEKKPVAEFLYVAVTQLVILALFTAFLHWWMYFVFWLYPLFTWTSFLIGLRAYLEHHDGDETSGVEPRLFDYRVNPAEHFFVSPCHFHLHAIHHAFPAVPHYRLPELKARLVQAELTYPGHDRPGYFSSFRRQMKKLGA